MSDTQSEQEAQAGETAAEGDFASLLEKEFKPKSERAKAEVQSAVSTLAEQVLDGEALDGEALVSDDAIATINSIIAEIDAKLTEQVNLILHNEEFQASAFGRVTPGCEKPWLKLVKNLALRVNL